MSQTPNKPSSTDAQTWLEEHGDVLFRFAMRRINSQETAEDLVQDTLISAMRAIDKFEGRSSVRTWLTGILHKKIIDHFRRSATEKRAKEVKQEEAEQQTFFTKNGHWKKTVKKWPQDPEKPIEDEEFWQVLRDCTSKLSEPAAVAFRLRDLDQISTEEACKILGITTTNLSVRLHRARLSLRECLEKNWFRRSDGDS